MNNSLSVGTSVVRVDAADKVRGTDAYVSDMTFPRMLHAVVVRSTVPHARLVKVDCHAARTMHGVAAVLTAKDIPGENCVPVVFRDQPLLATDTVRYVGEPIALIAAESYAAACRAADAITIEYEELSPLLDVCIARDNADVQLYKDNNVFSQLSVTHGNIDDAFKACDVIVENDYYTPQQEHAYLETQGMIAVPEAGGVMRIFGSMQCPFYVREGVATVLGAPLAHVHVTQTTTGGAFGGKEDFPSLPAAQAAVLAYHTHRPVKLIYTRDEDIAVSSKRHAAHVKAKHGATKDGILRAVDITYTIDGGAYSTLSPVVLFRGVIHAVGPYKCQNVLVNGYAVATNNVPAGAFRGFGSPQVLFAAERQMDELAKQLSLDPAEFRRKNLLRAGDATITQQTLPWSVGAHETLEKACASAQWHKKRTNTEWLNCTDSKVGRRCKRGIGLSTIYYGVGLGAGGEHMARTGAHISINHDGSVDFAVGTTEMGQGMKTVLSQIAATTLGIDISRIAILPTDTTRVPDSGPTVASRATTMSGRAVEITATTLRERMLKAAAEELQCDPASLSLENEELLRDGAPVNMTYMQLIELCEKKRIGLTAAGWHHPPHLTFDWETGTGDAYNVYAFATNIAEVEVDIDTGEVKVLQITAAHDVGKAVNPQMVEGQIEGGTLQGLGYALYEEIVQKNGAIINPHFSTYIIPTIADVPEIVPIIVEDPYPDGPYGAKGFGEQPLMGIAPAVANAVSHALSIPVTRIPLTPERIWTALQKKSTED